jgi:hypothetical protein
LFDENDACLGEGVAPSKVLNDESLGGLVNESDIRFVVYFDVGDCKSSIGEI